MRRSKIQIYKLVFLIVALVIIITLLSLNSDNNARVIPRKGQINRTFHQSVYSGPLHLPFQSEETNNDPEIPNLTSGSLTRMLANISDRLSKLEAKFEKSDVYSFLSEPIINNYTTPVVLNPLFDCSAEKINIILTILSPAINFNKRQTMRYGTVGASITNLTNVKMLFFIGLPPRGKYFKKQQLQIKAEADQFRDIVQESYEDVYSNNKYKTVSMLRWVNEFCSSAKYVILADSDTTFNISNLESVLDRMSESLTNFVIEMKRVIEVPVVGKRFKWNQKEAAGTVTKTLQGCPLASANLLYKAALRVDPALLESTYIGNGLAKKIHVPILTDSQFDFQVT